MYELSKGSDLYKFIQRYSPYLLYKIESRCETVTTCDIAKAVVLQSALLISLGVVFAIAGYSYILGTVSLIIQYMYGSLPIEISYLPGFGSAVHLGLVANVLVAAVICILAIIWLFKKCRSSMLNSAHTKDSFLVVAYKAHKEKYCPIVVVAEDD